jgi:hypothetical protein
MDQLQYTSQLMLCSQLNLAGTVTRCVCEKVAQNVAQSIFFENQWTTFTVKKCRPIICAISVIFTKKYPK